jgi:hypothetical protein
LGPLFIQTPADADRYLDMIQSAAVQAAEHLATFDGRPLDLLREMKFAPTGVHPVEARPVNFIEQVNQTWTYIVALRAACHLLKLHPDARGFQVAPGAHMALPLDIMSVEPGLVGAETFAAVHPRNNRKLIRDLAKLAADSNTQHRYVFFGSPAYPETRRRPELAVEGVEVWSVSIY